MPLVLASLVTGVASLSDVKKLSRIGGKTIAIYLSTTAFAVTIGLLAVNILNPGDKIPNEMQINFKLYMKRTHQKRLSPLKKLKIEVLATNC